MSSDSSNSLSLRNADYERRSSHLSTSPSPNRKRESEAESRLKQSPPKDGTRSDRPQRDVHNDATVVDRVFNDLFGQMEFRPSKIGPQHILKEDIPSKVSADKLTEIREFYGIPDDIEIRAPEGNERID